MPTVILNENNDWIYSRTICDCTDNRCDVDIDLNIGKDGYVEMGFQVQLNAMPDHRYNDPWYNNLIAGPWWRIKTMFRALFFGNIETNHYIILNQKAFGEFRDSLEKGIKQLESYQETKKEASE
jgi:hypothetical protein